MHVTAPALREIPTRRASGGSSTRLPPYLVRALLREVADAPALTARIHERLAREEP